ncbi:MAG: hypothetical protein J6C98_09625 [Oscillospiraceae bacterium]|nr:hypothetical protein [Oscillospiraceae bacterium]
MEKLKTATGKEFESDYLSVIPVPAQAYIRILDASLATVAAVFSDQKETVQLWHGEHYLAHYTHLVAIVPEMDAVKVVLAKE